MPLVELEEDEITRIVNRFSEDDRDAVTSRLIDKLSRHLPDRSKHPEEKYQNFKG